MRKKARTIPKLTIDRAVTTLPKPIVIYFHNLFGLSQTTHRNKMKAYLNKNTHQLAIRIQILVHSNVP